MATRKPFLLRTEPEVLAALQRWAADELRSVNGQIDFLLRRALQRAGRLPEPGGDSEATLPAGERRGDDRRGGGSTGRSVTRTGSAPESDESPADE